MIVSNKLKQTELLSVHNISFGDLLHQPVLIESFTDSLLAFLTSNSRLPPHNTAADLLPSGSVSAPPNHSYYAHYHQVSELQAVNDSFGTSSAHAELGPAQCNKLSHEEIGRVKHADGVTRMGPNSSHTPSFQEGDFIISLVFLCLILVLTYN